MPSLLHRRDDSDAAFERLYQRHVKDVYRYSLGVLGKKADAEDVTQTTFLNAYQAYRRGEQPEKPQNWLIAIAHNVCRQRFRQTQRRPPEVEFVEGVSPAADEHDGPSAADLKRALSELPPNQRAALVMRELEGRSYAEIAEVLSISISALETLIFRARRALREQLEERLTCSEAAFAISKQTDGRLSAAECRSLRAHLRACRDCTSDAQRERSMRRALKSMLLVPLPQSLATFSGGNAGVASTAVAGAGLTSGITLKAAALLTAGVVVGGGAYVGVEHPLVRHRAAPATGVVTTHVSPVPAHAAAGSPKRVGRPERAESPRASLRGKAHKQHAKPSTHRKQRHHGMTKTKTKPKPLKAAPAHARSATSSKPASAVSGSRATRKAATPAARAFSIRSFRGLPARWHRRRGLP